MTDKERAEKYRDAAKALRHDNYPFSATWLEEKAYALDPPQPEVPEGFVWYRLASSDMLLRGVHESGRVVDADGDSHPIERLAEVIPAPTIKPGHVVLPVRLVNALAAGIAITDEDAELLASEIKRAEQEVSQ